MDDYLQERVKDQIEDFYQPKALEYEKILKQLRIAGVVLGVLGAGLGAVSTATAQTWPAAWIAFIGTISGALAAFAFAGRYQYLLTSYQATAQRLTWLRNAWYRLPDAEKPKKAGEFVRKFEDTISVENSGWVAEWMGKS
jgi:conflict system pore-forming effector with SLATT domain